MDSNLGGTTMREQSRTIPIYAEHGPQGPDDDAELRAAYVECADSHPSGRKALGMYATRVAKAAAGTYTPRPSDCRMLKSVGCNTTRLALAFRRIADELDDTEHEGVAVTFAAVARETGEAVAAAAEHALAPSPATARRALKEVSEGMRVLSLFGRAVGRERLQRAAARNTPRGRVEVMR